MTEAEKQKDLPKTRVPKIFHIFLRLGMPNTEVLNVVVNLKKHAHISKSKVPGKDSLQGVVVVVLMCSSNSKNHPQMFPPEAK